VQEQAQQAVKEAALACRTILCQSRWLGGTLRIWRRLRKSIGRLKYIEEIEKSPALKKWGNRDRGAPIAKAPNSVETLDGILEMAQLPDALVVVDTTRDAERGQRAARLNIPTVAIVDTNADPEIIDYPIAGNDRCHSGDSRDFAEIGSCDCLGQRRLFRRGPGRDGGVSA